MKTITQIQSAIASLEQENAQMIERLMETDTLLRRIGFENGLVSVKEAAAEIIRMKNSSGHRQELDL